MIVGLLSASGLVLAPARATDGGIFSFGSAPFYGSLGASPPLYPIRSVAVLHVS